MVGSPPISPHLYEFSENTSLHKLWGGWKVFVKNNKRHLYWAPDHLGISEGFRSSVLETVKTKYISLITSHNITCGWSWSNYFDPWGDPGMEVAKTYATGQKEPESLGVIWSWGAISTRGCQTPQGNKLWLYLSHCCSEHLLLSAQFNSN